MIDEEEPNDHAKGYQSGMEDLYELMQLWVAELNSVNKLTDSQLLIIEKIMNLAEKVVYYEFKG